VKKLVLAAMTLSLLAGACAKAGSEDAGRGDSGIQGTVLVGPTCPVQTYENPCPDKPLAATVVVSVPGGDRVATARSGKDGKFRVAVPPGTYEIGTENLQGIQFSKPVSVTVQAGRFVEVTVSVDSGIRGAQSG
jgi:major membrane immunogen (membrane-anchored lipoprotein)